MPVYSFPWNNITILRRTEITTTTDMIIYWWWWWLWRRRQLWWRRRRWRCSGRRRCRRSGREVNYRSGIGELLTRDRRAWARELWFTRDDARVSRFQPDFSRQPLSLTSRYRFRYSSAYTVSATISDSASTRSAIITRRHRCRRCLWNVSLLSDEPACRKRT